MMPLVYMHVIIHGKCKPRRLIILESPLRRLIILESPLQRAKECKKHKDATSTTLRKTKMAAERCKEEIEAERRAITQLKKDREAKMIETERLRAQKQGSSKSTLRSLEVRD